MLTREEVGDGEDAERPPHGAHLRLLDQIVHAHHRPPHLVLPSARVPRARRGVTGVVAAGSPWRGGGFPPPTSANPNPLAVRAPPSPEMEDGGGATSSLGVFIFFCSLFIYSSWLFWAFGFLPMKRLHPDETRVCVRHGTWGPPASVFSLKGGPTCQRGPRLRS